jgi:hypothetical protein
MSNVGESQVFKAGNRRTEYVDARGHKCHAYNQYVDDLIVAYECDGPRGCEAIWNWSRKTRRLEKVRGPVGEEVGGRGGNA